MVGTTSNQNALTHLRYLFAIQCLIELSSWLIIEVCNIGLTAWTSIPANQRAIDGLFQATGLRTSGSYIINPGTLAPACLVFFVVAMYISNFPVVMALRQSNNYEESSIGIDEDADSGGLGVHLRNQLAYDVWFQILAWFLICISQRAELLLQEEGFQTFNILFEVTSAYGTVGLSTGVPGQDYSLSGRFNTLSKVIMLFVMVRGRHRGLPLAIDRAILVPGEQLMHELDERYNGLGNTGGGNAKGLGREKRE